MPNDPARARQIIKVIEQILAACAEHKFISPYEVVLSDEHGIECGAKFFHDRPPEPLQSADWAPDTWGEINSPFIVEVTDADLNYVDFKVHLLERADGTQLRPLIEWPEPDKWHRSGLRSVSDCERGK